MPFNSKSAKKVGKKSKRGPAKKEGPSIKEKMVLLYEKVLDNLLINQDKLTKTERLKLFVTLSGHLFPKNKTVKEKIKDMPPFQISDYITFTSGDESAK